MALLTGDLANQVFAAFKGKLLFGLIRQFSAPISGGLDSYGDAIETVPTDTAIQGFVEDYSAYYRATAGIPATDIRVNIFAKSAPAIVPGRDDKVQMNGVWYQLRAVTTDPATAMWTCQAFPIPSPEA